MTPFVANASRWRTMAGLLGCAGFVALGWAILRISADWAGWAIGLLAIVTFGGFAGIGLWRLRISGPLLRIDADGIWRRGAPIVPWRAIVHARETVMHRQRFLLLWLDDGPSYRAPGLLTGANRVLGLGDISLGVQGTDARFDDLLAAFAHFSGGALK